MIRRGRSTTPQRSAAGTLGRSAIAAFVAALNVGDIIAIEWRIVPLDAPSPALGISPFLPMSGKILSIEAVTAEDKPKVVAVEYTDNGQPPAVFGTYDLPPQAIDNAFIEIKSLVKLPPLLPTFGSLFRKRDREEPPQQGIQEREQSRANLHEIRLLTEAIKGEQITQKVEICKGLRIVDDDSNIWHPFRLFDWVQSIRTQETEAQRLILVTGWRVELLQSLTDAGVQFGCAGQGNHHALHNYNEARDQVARWLLTSADTPLDTKRQWALGFQLLFSLAAAAATISFGFQRGVQLKTELSTEFEKSSAVIDMAAVLNRIFRGRRSGPSAGDNKSRDKNSGDSKPDRRLGLDKPTGEQGERKCQYCNKYHNQPGVTGRNFWLTHRCK